MLLLQMSKHNKLPPGPKGKPFVGSLFEFRKDPLAFLLDIAQEYGDVRRFQLGRKQIVQVNHPDLIREILVSNPHNYCKTGVLEARSPCWETD